MQIMVVAAHPDDIERHCGGTVARWVQEGWGGVFVLCTSGNRGSDDAAISPEELARLRERAAALGHSHGMGLAEGLRRVVLP